jgi:hypothetical protein
MVIIHKKTNIIYFKTLVFICILTLAGCEKIPINIVKKSYIDSSERMTIEDALKDRPLCRSVKWEKFKDEKGEDVVQYSCFINDGKDFNRKERSSYIDLRINDQEKYIESTKERLEKLQVEMKEDFPDLRERIERLRYREGVLESGTQEKSKKIIDMEKLLMSLDPYLVPYDEKKMIELVHSKILDDKIIGGSGGILLRLEYMSRLPQDKVEKYKQSEIIPDLKKLHLGLGSTKKMIQSLLDHEIWINKKNNKENFSYIKDQKNKAIENLEYYRNNLRKNIASTQKNLTSLQSKEAEETIKKEALERYPAYADTLEIFQWIVNKKKMPLIIYGELQGKLESGEEKTIVKYNNPRKLIFLASNSKAKTTNSYISDIREFGIFQMLVK